MARITLGLKTLSQQTIVAGGTPQPLSLTQLFVSSAVVQAESGNADDILIGDSTVAPTKCLKITPGNFAQLNAEDSLADEDSVVIDLSQVFIDGTTEQCTLH